MRDFIERHPVGRWATNFLLILALGLLVFWLNGRATTAEQALCTLRGDYEHRLADTITYRGEVAAGRRRPIKGLTRSDLDRAENGLRDNIEALSGLDCR